MPACRIEDLAAQRDDEHVASIGRRVADDGDQYQHGVSSRADVKRRSQFKPA